MYNNTTHLTVGVLLVDTSIQMSDIATVDILTMVSTNYMSILPPNLAPPAAALATPMDVVYITESGASPLTITGGAKIVITHSIQTAPKLDILVVPGPPPAYRANEATKSFIKGTYESGAHVLSVCTGILAVAASGILDDKIGTGPIGMIPMLREFFPKVKWNDARRYERNAAEGTAGQVWSSGSILDGVDEVAAFVREHFAAEIAECTMYMASVPERSAEYSKMEKEWGDRMAALV
ncbi:class I glutamine amidotransferase-like protein [Peniophora sp. CONT]|nr:class I glutamine amidotransferase-like protein [Peniophora sp. CONT]